MESSKTKEYSNGEITIVWKPGACIHSTNCWKGKDGLLSVFNPSKRPWVNMEGAATDAIIAQVEKCPSGALSYYRNDEAEVKEENSIPNVHIQVAPGGPLLVKGSVSITLEDGTIETKDQMCALCRCGKSANKPYCDGSHR